MGSGRRTLGVIEKRQAIIDKAWDIVGRILDDDKSPKHLDTAHDIVLKDITIKMEGKGFGDVRNIYQVISQIQQDFVRENSKSSLVLHRGDSLDTGRTRPEESLEEIPKQGVS